MSETPAAPLTDTDRRGSPERFGYEWNTYADILPIYEEQFRRWTPHFKPEDWRGKTFLDVGCGMGRNSYWPLSYGAAASVSADIDDRSLAAASRNLAKFPHADILRCSAYDLAFENSFDIVFSIGVIHHLDAPARALARMEEAAKPGGQVAIWVYGKENNEWLISFLDPLRNALFSKMPVSAVHHLSLYPAAMLFLLLRLGIRPIAYFRLIAQFGFGHLRSIVFDQMLPRIAHYWSRDEVAALMQTAGLQDVQIEWVNEMSWAAVGRKQGQGALPPAPPLGP
jgi:SAM-dependent methyltransferase